MMADTLESIEDLQQAVISGVTDWDRYGAVRTERMDGLILFDYKSSAQWDARWNWFERVSRGLILDTASGEVVARPFDKFFNWGEGGQMPDTPLADVTDKLDGSLGILYRHQGEIHIATRGAFRSDHALWATDFLRRNYDLTGLPDNLTLLFEIIYPANRVVLNYEGREDLSLIGMRDRFTGEDYFRPQIAEIAERFGFSMPETYPYTSVGEILDASSNLPISREGWVVRFTDGGRYKVKGEAYKVVHRIVTMATFGQVLDAMSTGTLDKVIEGVPDEFLGQVRAWQGEIETVLADTRQRVESIYAAAPKSDRKTFALWVREHHAADSAYLFALHDGHDLTPIMYRVAFKRQQS